MSGHDIEIGTVKSVSDGRTIVELTPGAVCESCSARILCRPGSDGSHEMAVQNTLNARPGDRVELGETGNLLLILSLLQYGIPLLGLLAGVFLVYGIDPAFPGVRVEVLMAAAGFTGMILGGVAANFGLALLSRKIDSVFSITAVRSTDNPP